MLAGVGCTGHTGPHTVHEEQQRPLHLSKCFNRQQLRDQPTAVGRWPTGAIERSTDGGWSMTNWSRLRLQMRLPHRSHVMDGEQSAFTPLP